MKPLQKTDPLYTIFEQHLCNFQDPKLNPKGFSESVAQEYLVYLKKQKFSIPLLLEGAILEELELQIHTMLIKKIYGAFSIQEYQEKIQPSTKRKAKSNYKKLISRL